MKHLLLSVVVAAAAAAASVGTLAQASTVSCPGDCGAEGISSLLSLRANVSVSKFTAAAKEAADQLQNADGCSLTTETTSAGLVVTVTGDSTVSLVVPAGARITHSVKNGTDIYKVANKGTLAITNADDAYYSATLTAGGQSATCEVDF